MSNDNPAPSISENEDNSAVRETTIEEREFALKEKEFALREREAEARIRADKKNILYSSPLLIGLASAIFGLIGTGIGAGLQGYSNFQLERQEFESSLIQKSLEIKDRKEAAKSLLFLVDSGIIKSLDSEKIRKFAENPEQLPILSELFAKSNNSEAFALSPDGKSFAVTDNQGEVKIWSIDGKLLLTFQGHKDTVSTMTYSPDGKMLFTASDGIVMLWSLSGELISRLEIINRLKFGEKGNLIFNDRISNIAIAPDGEKLIVRTTSNRIIQWDIKTNTKVDRSFLF